MNQSDLSKSPGAIALPTYHRRRAGDSWRQLGSRMRISAGAGDVAAFVHHSRADLMGLHTRRSPRRAGGDRPLVHRAGHWAYSRAQPGRAPGGQLANKVEGALPAGVTAPVSVPGIPKPPSSRWGTGVSCRRHRQTLAAICNAAGVSAARNFCTHSATSTTPRDARRSQIGLDRPTPLARTKSGCAKCRRRGSIR
jgi:hypothetical protein